MGQSSSKNPDVFITHTEPECPGRQCNRATIACTIRDKKIVYGIAICSKGDNFSRKEGRKLAEDRMNQGYGQYSLISPEDFYVAGRTPNESVATFALNLRRAVGKNYERYKRKINDFRTATPTTTHTN